MLWVTFRHPRRRIFSLAVMQMEFSWVHIQEYSAFKKWSPFNLLILLPLSSYCYFSPFDCFLIQVRKCLENLLRNFPVFEYFCWVDCILFAAIKKPIFCRCSSFGQKEMCNKVSSLWGTWAFPLKPIIANMVCNFFTLISYPQGLDSKSGNHFLEIAFSKVLMMMRVTLFGNTCGNELTVRRFGWGSIIFS